MHAYYDPESGRIDDVFVRDREAHTTERVSVSSGGVAGNGHSDVITGGISADGRYVAFLSAASNLVATRRTKNSKLFVRDRKLGLTEPVCVASQDAPFASFNECSGCGMSADGRYIAFTLFDNDFNAIVFVRDRETHLTQRVGVTPGSFGFCPWNALSGSGRYLMYFPYDPSDPNWRGVCPRPVARL